MQIEKKQMEKEQIEKTQKEKEQMEKKQKKEAKRKGSNGNSKRRILPKAEKLLFFWPFFVTIRCNRLLL